jgi:hypothetical protein
MSPGARRCRESSVNRHRYNVEMSRSLAVTRPACSWQCGVTYPTELARLVAILFGWTPDSTRPAAARRFTRWRMRAFSVIVYSSIMIENR